MAETEDMPTVEMPLRCRMDNAWVKPYPRVVIKRRQSMSTMSDVALNHKKEQTLIVKS
jgi:hypothetical protein